MLLNYILQNIYSYSFYYAIYIFLYYNYNFYYNFYFSYNYNSSYIFNYYYNSSFNYYYNNSSNYYYNNNSNYYYNIFFNLDFISFLLINLYCFFYYIRNKVYIRKNYLIFNIFCYNNRYNYSSPNSNLNNYFNKIVLRIKTFLLKKY